MDGGSGGGERAAGGDDERRSRQQRDAVSVPSRPLLTRSQRFVAFPADGDDSIKSSGSSGASAPDMVRLESLLLPPNGAPRRQSAADAGGDASLAAEASQRLRVLVHAEMRPARSLQAGSEGTERSPSLW